MNTFRIALIASAAALAAACASNAGKPTASPTPVAPAATNIAGDWTITTVNFSGTQQSTMKVEQIGKDIKGFLDSPTGQFEYVGTVEANNVTFGFTTKFQDTDLRIDFAGALVGGEIRGKQKFGPYAEGTFTARRK